MPARGPSSRPNVRSGGRRPPAQKVQSTEVRKTWCLKVGFDDLKPAVEDVIKL